MAEENKAPKVLVPLAEGFEEIEAVTIIDILRRAGAEVVTASMARGKVTGSHGISVLADILLDAVHSEEFDMIALPGGMPGTLNLKQSKKIVEIVQKLNQAGKITAAVCAAPVVLEEAGILKNRTVTSHPNHAKFIVQGKHTGGRLEKDGIVVTGQAAGSAMEFAFQLVEILFGKNKVEEINKTVLAKL